MKQSIWLAGALLLAIGSQSVATELPGKGIKVQPVQNTIKEESFQTVIVDRALERLGYDVQPIKQINMSVAYTAVADGDAQFFADGWFPLHNKMYENSGGDKVLYSKGNYISGAAQGYLIDKKTAEKYHITSLSDLKKPKIAKLFDTDGDGKADLTACQVGWGCEAVINYQMDAFKLHKSVTPHWGQYGAIIADTIARFDAGKPVLYYTWTPYWVSGRLVPGKDVTGYRYRFQLIQMAWIQNFPMVRTTVLR